MRQSLRTSLFLVLVFLCGCGGESYPPTAEGVYNAKCSRCHELDGSSTTATELADAPIDLRKAFFQKNVSGPEMKRIMEFGAGRMQGVPDLTPADLDSIVLHIRFLGRQYAEQNHN